MPEEGRSTLKWFLALHRWSVEPKTALDMLQRHRQWVLAQHSAGSILISGPSTDLSLGIMVVRAADMAAAQALMAEEPWIAAGMRSVEIIQWDVHELLGLDLTSETTAPGKRNGV